MIPGKSMFIMQSERVNTITQKFERLLNTTLATDYSLENKLGNALQEIDDIGTLD